MGGIEALAQDISEEMRRRLPEQRKTQRENLALLVATMLDVRSANLMELAATLPGTAERIDMRYQWIARVLANPLTDCDAVMTPFTQEVLARAAALDRVEVILDQSKLSERHQVLMLPLRFGERCLWPGRSSKQQGRSAWPSSLPYSTGSRPGCPRQAPTSSCWQTGSTARLG